MFLELSSTLKRFAPWSLVYAKVAVAAIVAVVVVVAAVVAVVTIKAWAVGSSRRALAWLQQPVPTGLAKKGP